jgi:hypothetical protein
MHNVPKKTGFEPGSSVFKAVAMTSALIRYNSNQPLHFLGEPLWLSGKVVKKRK